MPRVARWESVHVWRVSQGAGPVVGQNPGFTGGEPVVTQNNTGSKTVGNGERAVGAVTTIVGGDT